MATVRTARKSATKNTKRSTKKASNTKKETVVKKSKAVKKSKKAVAKPINVTHKINKEESESFRAAMRDVLAKSPAEIKARDAFYLSLTLLSDAKTTDWKELFAYYNSRRVSGLKNICLFSDSSAVEEKHKGLQGRNAMYEAQHKEKFPNRPLHLNYGGTRAVHADGERCILKQFGLDTKYANVLKSKLGQDCKKKFFKKGATKKATKRTTKK